MSSMPIIGIPCATYERKYPYPIAHGNNVTYLRAVERAGGAPLLIPQVEDEATLYRLFEQLDGLLLAGGADVDPRHYGETPHPMLGEVKTDQDRIELLLCRWAREVGMPILGVCRGFQILNVAFGGSLYQDLPAQHPSKINHSLAVEQGQRDLLSHGLTLAEDSRLAGLLDVSDLQINTLHHQGIKVLADGLIATGWADDGLIEAFEGADEHWITAVQCHPEELVRGADQRWNDVFAAFAQAAQAWRGSEVKLAAQR